MRKPINSNFPALFRNSIFLHLLFWTLSWYVLLNVFSVSSSFQKIDFIYTSVFLITLLIPVELNLLFLVPRFLKRNNWFIYGILFISTLLFFGLFNQFLFNELIDRVFPGYFFISYYSYFDILKFFTVFMVVTTLLHLSKEWFELNEARQRMNLLQKEKVEAELKALSNQVNPHFLFNSLNVLYSLSINNSRQAPEAIIKLSDILRYVIYESNKDSVKLGSEISLIHNYIDLQQFRVTTDTNVQFDYEVEDETLQIAPMLFLPLVENSYKHGIKGDIKNTFIHIQLNQKEDYIDFSIKNNKGQSGEPNNQRSGGVGLENIRNRLQLIYPKCYTFEMEDHEHVFGVKLKIKIKK